MSIQVIGTCSICGGRVVVPMVFHSIYPPVPTCSACGAVENKPEKVIPMKMPRTVSPTVRELQGYVEDSTSASGKKLLNG